MVSVRFTAQIIMLYGPATPVLYIFVLRENVLQITMQNDRNMNRTLIDMFGNNLEHEICHGILALHSEFGGFMQHIVYESVYI